MKHKIVTRIQDSFASDSLLLQSQLPFLALNRQRFLQEMWMQFPSLSLCFNTQAIMLMTVNKKQREVHFTTKKFKLVSYRKFPFYKSQPLPSNQTQFKTHFQQYQSLKVIGSIILKSNFRLARIECLGSWFLVLGLCAFIMPSQQVQSLVRNTLKVIAV